MRNTLSLLAAFLATASLAVAQEDPRRPIAKTPALTPAQTAAQLVLPEGFRTQLIRGEPDIVQPIAYTLDDRGRLWILENTNYPNCPGEPKDRILVLEDTKGDGTFDKTTVFFDKATFSSGIAVGFNGVWVGSPPNLLFIPLADGDTPKPAGPPQIVLDGWGNQDTHETLNTFVWGPDGWLYGTQGIFTQSLVGKPTDPKEKRTFVDAGIWRFHPLDGRFELWAEGGSNQWGVDWNDQGEAFFEACVIPHLWHAMEGARYLRQAGPHPNPHTYADIQTIAWGRYEKAAYCGAMVYLGDAFPANFRNNFFFNDIHMNRMRRESLERNGSGFKSTREKEFVHSPDAWYRGLNTQYGPDGGLFINDWYDRVPCHQQKAFTDRSNGRIYRIINDAVKPRKVDLAKLPSSELVNLQLHRNEWFVRHARRILQERGFETPTASALQQMLSSNEDPTRRLRALWTLHAIGGLTQSVAESTLSDQDESVRGWTVTLLCENGDPAESLLPKLRQLAASDPSPLVRRRIASAAQRLSPTARMPLISALSANTQDAADPNIPLLTWYAAEGAIAANPSNALDLLAVKSFAPIPEFTARRLTAAYLEKAHGAEHAFLQMITLIAAQSELRPAILKGMLAGFKGQTSVPESDPWKRLFPSLLKDASPDVANAALSLGVLFGNADALATLRSRITNETASPDARKEAISALASRRDSAALKPILELAISNGTLRDHAIRALTSFPPAAWISRLTDTYAAAESSSKAAILNALATSKEGAASLVKSIDAGRIPIRDLQAPVARLIREQGSTTEIEWLAKNWGSVKPSRDETQKQIERFKRFLGQDAITRADLPRGRELFRAICATCHTMFGGGGRIGPELPGNFHDVDYLLHNILDPNAEIGKDYQQTFIEMKNGELRSGIVTARTGASVTLNTLAGSVTLPAADIQKETLSPNSMMPEGLLNGLTEGDVRSLFLYLRQTKD
jgi:putative membrane-bound dehydrogenase-like protein